jgi:hypothetical protein
VQWITGVTNMKLNNESQKLIFAIITIIVYHGFV